MTWPSKLHNEIRHLSVPLWVPPDFQSTTLKLELGEVLCFHPWGQAEGEEGAGVMTGVLLTASQSVATRIRIHVQFPPPLQIHPDRLALRERARRSNTSRNSGHREKDTHITGPSHKLVLHVAQQNKKLAGCAAGSQKGMSEARLLLQLPLGEMPPVL